MVVHETIRSIIHFLSIVQERGSVLAFLNMLNIIIITISMMTLEWCHYCSAPYLNIYTSYLGELLFQMVAADAVD